MVVHRKTEVSPSMRFPESRPNPTMMPVIIPIKLMATCRNVSVGDPKYIAFTPPRPIPVGSPTTPNSTAPTRAGRNDTSRIDGAQASAEFLNWGTTLPCDRGLFCAKSVQVVENAGDELKRRPG